MSGALQAVFQNQRSFLIVTGQQAFTSSGSFTWVAPAGVTKVSVLAVGGGAGDARAIENGEGVALLGESCEHLRKLSDFFGR